MWVEPTGRRGVHHRCIDRNRAMLQKAGLCNCAGIDWIHLHTIIQSTSPTGLQTQQQDKVLSYTHLNERSSLSHLSIIIHHMIERKRMLMERVKVKSRQSSSVSVCVVGSLPTCMRNTLDLVSMYSLSKYAKMLDSRTGFPSAPNTQPSSPWDDKTAKKHSLTGRRLSAAQTHNNTHTKIITHFAQS